MIGEIKQVQNTTNCYDYASECCNWGPVFPVDLQSMVGYCGKCLDSTVFTVGCIECGEPPGFHELTGRKCSV